jgi:hypothetical protein
VRVRGGWDILVKMEGGMRDEVLELGLKLQVEYDNIVGKGKVILKEPYRKILGAIGRVQWG